MRILGALEVKEKWYFNAKHVAGVENTLADLITRCERSKINMELKGRRKWERQSGRTRVV